MLRENNKVKWWLAGPLNEGNFLDEVKELRDRGQYHKALEQLRAIVETFNENEYQELLECLNLQSYCLWRVGQFDKAEEDSRRIMKLAEAHDDMKNLAESLAILGAVFLDTGRLNDAQRTMGRSLDLFTKLNDQPNIARVLNNLGIVASERVDLEEAFKLWTKTLDLYKELQNKQGIGDTLINLGEVFRMRGELTEAEKYYEESLQYFEHYSFQDIALAKHNLGLVYYQRGELAQAEMNFREVLKLIQHIENPKEIADVQYELIRVLLAQNRFQEASCFIESLEDLAQSSNLPDVITRFHLGQSLLQSKEYELKSALLHAQKAKKKATEYPLAFLQIEAMYLVLQSLLQLYLISKKEDFREKIESELVELVKLTQREEINEALATTLLIAGLLKKSEFDFASSHTNFVAAKNLAEKYGFSLLAEKARTELANLELEGSQDIDAGFLQTSKQQNLETLIAFVESTQEPLKLDPEQVFMFVVKFGQRGPTVFQAEQTPFPEKESKSLLAKAAIFISTALGQGTIYHEGLFGPFPLLIDYFCLVYAKTLPDATMLDPRCLGTAYTLVCLCYPKKFDNLFVDRETTASIFQKWTDSIDSVWSITDEFMRKLREEVVSNCFSAVQFLRRLE